MPRHEAVRLRAALPPDRVGELLEEAARRGGGLTEDDRLRFLVTDAYDEVVAELTDQRYVSARRAGRAGARTLLVEGSCTVVVAADLVRPGLAAAPGLEAARVLAHEWWHAACYLRGEQLPPQDGPAPRAGAKVLDEYRAEVTLSRAGWLPAPQLQLALAESVAELVAAAREDGLRPVETAHAAAPLLATEERLARPAWRLLRGALTKNLARELTPLLAALPPASTVSATPELDGHLAVLAGWWQRWLDHWLAT